METKRPLIPWYAWVAAAVTILLITGGLGMLAAAAGDSIGIGTWISAGVFGALVLFVISSLSANRKVATASEAERRAALGFTPPPGKALVFAYRQGFIGKAVGLNVEIDGRPVAQIKSPRFTCITVEPGSYRLSGAFSGMAATQNRGDAIEFVAVADESYCFRFDISMGLAKNSIAIASVERPIAQAAMRTMRMTVPDVAAL